MHVIEPTTSGWLATATSAADAISGRGSNSRRPKTPAGPRRGEGHDLHHAPGLDYDLIVETKHSASRCQEKTRVVHIDERIDFLGWRINARRREPTAAATATPCAPKRPVMAVSANVTRITRSGHKQTVAQLPRQPGPVLHG
jgi:hypothetical protein